MYNSGFGRSDSSTSYRVSIAFTIGTGRKIMVPLHVLRELYVGILWVYVPSQTTVWYALAFWTNWQLKQSNFANLAGMGTVPNHSTYLVDMSLHFNAVLQFGHMNSFLYEAWGLNWDALFQHSPHHAYFVRKAYYSTALFLKQRVATTANILSKVKQCNDILE